MIHLLWNIVKVFMMLCVTIFGSIVILLIMLFTYKEEVIDQTVSDISDSILAIWRIGE